MDENWHEKSENRGLKFWGKSPKNWGKSPKIPNLINAHCTRQDLKIAQEGGFFSQKQ